MGKRISVHSAEEYCNILESIDKTAVFEFNSSVFVVGSHPSFGSVIGISNLEECFIITD